MNKNISSFTPCLHLYVVVAVLGEEQELDLSPRMKRLALGPPARGLSAVWDGGPRKLIYSPRSPPSPTSPPGVLFPLSPWCLSPTSIRYESSDGDESSGMSTISDISRDPLSMDTNKNKFRKFLLSRPESSRTVKSLFMQSFHYLFNLT